MRTPRHGRAGARNNSVSPATDPRRSRRTNSSAEARAGSTAPPSAPPIDSRAPTQNVFPEHGCVEQQPLLLRRQRVDPPGDDSLHGLGKVIRGIASLREHARELLGVERVAARADEQGLLASAGSTCRSSSALSSRAVSPSPSGASESVWAFRLPPPQPGRRSSSSGRAVVTTRSGTLSIQSASSSTKSSRSSSAQWRSSKTMTVGPRSASASTKRRRAAKLSPRAPPASVESHERPQPRLDPGIACGDERGDASRKLPLGVCCRVALEDAGLGLHHLGECPEAPPSPYGSERP